MHMTESAAIDEAATNELKVLFGVLFFGATSGDLEGALTKFKAGLQTLRQVRARALDAVKQI